MKQVLLTLVVGLAIVSTACGANLQDAERNVRGVIGNGKILIYPNGQTVSMGQDDYFVVCSTDGIVGVATLTIHGTTGLVRNVETRWVQDYDSACGVKLDDLTAARAQRDILINMIKSGATRENLEKEVRDIEFLKEYRHR